MKYGDHCQFNTQEQTEDEIAAILFNQMLDTVKAIGKTITEGTIEFTMIEPTDTTKYDKAIMWTFETNE